MKKFSEIIETIKTLKHLKSEAQVAEFLGLFPQALNRSKRQELIPFEQIANFCEREGISLDWLLFGKGEQQPAAPVTMDDLKQQLDDLKKHVINIESRLKK